MVDWPLAAGFALIAFVVSRAWLFWQNLKTAQYISGIRCAFSNFLPPGAFIPTTSWNPGQLFTWRSRDDLYRTHNQELISMAPFIIGPTMFYTCSAEVAKQVLGHKSGFDKIAVSVESLAPFGPNLFSSYQEQWPRHRRIVNPGFNTKLYAQVWSECVKIYYDMIAHEGWTAQSSSVIPIVSEITSKIALHIIASCGFGIPLSWDGAIGGKVNGMTVQDCFNVTSSSIIPMVLFPKWVLRLPFKPLRRIINAIDNLEGILRGIIQKRRLEGNNQGSEKETDAKDVFSLLLKANDAEEDQKSVLSDQELVSNVFLLLIAGHETTGKAMGATLGLLACNPDQQELAYLEIMSALPDGRDPTFDDYDSLPFVLACFLEALRFYPSAHMIPRRAVTDQVLTVPTKDGQTTKVLIKKGTVVALDMIGIGYNRGGAASRATTFRFPAPSFYSRDDV